MIINKENPIIKNEVNEILIIDLNNTYDSSVRIFNYLLLNIISKKDNENTIYPIIRIISDNIKKDYRILNVKKEINKNSNLIEIYINAKEYVGAEEKNKRSDINRLDIYADIAYYDITKDKKNIENVNNINIQIKIGNRFIFYLGDYTLKELLDILRNASPGLLLRNYYEK
jgi:hypothetical protein